MNVSFSLNDSNFNPFELEWRSEFPDFFIMQIDFCDFIGDYYVGVD